MGYEMPNVVKTVIIPFSESDSEISFEQYKQKYGIDLEEVLEITIDNGGHVGIIPRPNCIYYANYVESKKIIPLLIVNSGSGYYDSIALDTYVDLESNNNVILSAYMHILGDKTILYSEV